MDSWSAPVVPRLPGAAVPLALFDTATRTVRPSKPATPPRLYVCGITPYDATHLGHAATMITFDLINRLWLDTGQVVQYVQNVTDVDDGLLARAARDGEEWTALAEREIALFRTDMETLRILPPEHYLGAVEAIPEVVELVERLVAQGAAYRLGDDTNDVYFDTRAAKYFGYQSGYDRATMLSLNAECGGDPDRAGKRDPLDPLLWRDSQYAGQPSWPSPLGAGRPGWHIECAAIALRWLGSTVDVQGGGSDLIFPHHDFSAAHIEAITGERPFAKHYVHCGMIGLDGEKMSKSKGNLVLLSRLRAVGVDSMAVRLGLLAGHYRTDRPWTEPVLAAAAERLARWRAAVRRSAGPPGEELLRALRERLSADLDTPGALAAVDRWAASDGTDVTAPALVTDAVDALLGIRL
ncbi:L-cysteine:1D-myo-inositol 2-amino-2-deoxy-alpha-D-glucopyranoside ligase [Actinocatenispora thailandica]|uniref:L-cysteine:1D-myo-inositol 2-amino-2-deoxy-alpha-D-glucopyranoside ligase n=1 Tax=Actinocatenispora thailandica TaxID=227318 RepID=A0A7R7DLD6_9ACTN|nr:cysteine--1-D-myo-inosityl 2-amino-2-deoxy-alpha-D-glucopyranoside ligase [Actinocatenispora thailandica]BCJ33879.1 L-cysteine:1D-myo-inositol 2-amino-2-deoxy-alpha-D-glucopyranoside ligase [Actinocatenispora thailandica]